MTTRDETTYWDAMAERDPKSAVWSEPDFDGGVDSCIAALIAELPEGRVLDLGCGIGRLAVPIAEMGRRVVGVDSSPAMLLRAKPHPRVSYLLNDGRNLPDDLGMVDGAYSVLLFQHLEDDTVKGYLRQVQGWLRSGGMFRFQFVEGQEDIGFSRMKPLSQMLEWLREADFNVADVDEGYVFPSWVWITGGKP